MHPRDYGLPHDEWNEWQEDSVKWAANLEGIGILESPPGTGKTAIASAMRPTASTLGGNVISLTHTKLLQSDNYEKQYGFAPLYGMNNYPCALPNAAEGATFAQCRHRRNYNACPSKRACTYLHAIDRARLPSTTGVTLNYAYWVHAYERWNPQWLFMDEGHRLSEITINWAGITFSRWQIENYDLPSPPTILRTTGTFRPGRSPKDLLLKWLNLCAPAIAEWIAKRQSSRRSSAKLLQVIHNAEMMQLKLASTISALSGSTDWFISSTSQSVSAFPYSAAQHFSQLISTAARTVIMSATIGDFDIFSEELGLSSFSARRVGSPYASSSRPIVDLGVPILGNSAKDSAWELQADAIASAILDCPPWWAGLIHTTSKLKARELAARLAKRGLKDRLWLPPELPTNEQIVKWSIDREENPSLIAIPWGWWEGYNGLDERINIVAKTPYPYLGDPYERERQKRAPKFYRQRTAWMLIQGLGRTRRQPSDFDTDGEQNGLVAIADGSWRQVQKYIPQYIRDSIVKK